MHSQAHVKDFKFHYVQGGNKVGFRAKSGTIGDDWLSIGEDRVHYEDIVDTTTRGNRLIVTLSEGFQAGGKLAKYLIEGRVFVLEPRSPNARTLEMAIDRKCADVEVAHRRAELKSKGLGHLLRT